MDVALVFPRIKYGEHSPPLGLAYIASVLEKNGFNISIIDLTFEKEFDFLRRRLKELEPKLIGITCQTTFAEEAFEAARISKTMIPRAIIVLGGPHPTVLPEKTLEESGADIVVIGEGEYTFKEIAEKIEGGESFKEVEGICYKEGQNIRFSGERTLIDDLDGLPLPARHLFDERYLEHPEITMINSRGCPFHCSFCQPTLSKIFGRKVRLRSPKNVVEEIKLVLATYGNKTIRFHDDTFTWNKKWTKELCDFIRKENLKITWNCKSRVDVIDRELVRMLKQAGCVRIDMGIESGSQRLLDEILNKGITIEQTKDAFKICYEQGMKTSAFIMVGIPTERPKEVLDTINLIEQMKIDDLNVSIFTPFPGTKIFNFALEKGLLTAESWNNYDFYSEVSMRHHYFTPERIREVKEIIQKGIAAEKLFKNLPRPLIRYTIHPRSFFCHMVNLVKLAKTKRSLKKKDMQQKI